MADFFVKDQGSSQAGRGAKETPPVPTDFRLKWFFQTGAKDAALLVMALAGMALAGFPLEIAALRTWLSGGPPISVNASLGFMAGGLSLWLWTLAPARRLWRGVAKCLGIVVVLLGLGTLLGHWTHMDIEVDHLLTASRWQMSPFPALALLFFGVALVFLDRTFRRRFRPAEFLALAGGGIGLLTLLAYAYGVGLQLCPPNIVPMSLPSSVFCILLALGILGMRPMEGGMSLLSSRTPAGHLMRRLLLLLVVAPVLLGWVGLMGEWKGWYNTEVGAVLVVSSNMILFGAALFTLGWTLLEAQLRSEEVERRLLTREADFKATFEQAAVGIAHTAPDGSWVRVNEKLCKITGYNREELLKKTFLDITVPEDREASLEATRRLMEGEIDQFTLEKRYIRKDGKMIWVNLTAAMLRDPCGRPRYAIVVVDDISARKETEQELARQKAVAEEVSLSKDRLLSVISHELRTPLTPVLAALSSGAPESLGPEQRPLLEMMRRNIEHEVCLIDDLLDLTRLSSGKLRLSLAPLDFHALVQEVFDSVEPTLKLKGIESRLDLRAPFHTVRGDPARLRQVLLNLLDNAKKFTPTGGLILIRSHGKTDEDGSWVVLRITDTGAGIAPGNLQRIFDAFEQAEPVIQRRYGGLGLGLAITRGLMEAHSGLLEVESPGLGRGSTFAVALRAIDEPVFAPAPPCKTETIHARILLVEDHADTRLTLQRLLKRRGHKVRTAASVAEAVAATGHEPFDLLLSDIGLPDGSGLEILEKAAASGHPMPGIALSGFGTEEDIKQSSRAGFVRHLTKPVNMEALEEAIAEVMQELRRDRRKSQP